jgi:hypothetical protein
MLALLAVLAVVGQVLPLAVVQHQDKVLLVVVLFLILAVAVAVRVLLVQLPLEAVVMEA